MKLGKPIKIAKGVFQVRAIGARVTVLVHDNEVVLVDTGSRGSLGMISAGLEAVGLSLDNVGKVVVTHHHPDHTGGLSELVQGRDIKVAAHGTEAAMIAGTETTPNPMQSRLLAMVSRPFVKRLIGAPVPVDYHLSDGDLIPFGNDIRVVHLPGHTAGSIALHLPSKKIIIVGDALQYKFGWRLSPPAPGVTQQPEEAIRSLTKLLTLDFDTICFSHFPPKRNGAQAALQQLVKRHSGGGQ
jgi:glyoxylase-like metal-dependent hydrolase (beta-lactamase superfamily II)